jgi:hypothetical protein
MTTPSHPFSGNTGKQTKPDHRKANLAKGKKWQAGQSGNPSGRPKGYAEMAELARSKTPEAIETLVACMGFGVDGRVRVMAAEALLDRGWGKVAVNVEMSGEVKFPLSTVVAKLLEERPE